MANTAIYPIELLRNSSGLSPTTDSMFSPTTTVTYEVKMADSDKIGIFVTYLAASSVSSVRMKITPPSSTDGAWGYGVGSGPLGTTGASTYFTVFTNDFPITASSESRTFFGPFESARFGSLSTITAMSGYRTMKLTFDATTANGSTSIGSTSCTLATIASTIHVIAFKMP